MRYLLSCLSKATKALHFLLVKKHNVAWSALQYICVCIYITLGCTHTVYILAGHQACLSCHVLLNGRAFALNKKAN